MSLEKGSILANYNRNIDLAAVASELQSLSSTATSRTCSSQYQLAQCQSLPQRMSSRNSLSSRYPRGINTRVGGDIGESEDWSNLIMKFGSVILLHPLEYAKTLIQLGHEPLPPHVGKTLFGKEVMIYPNILHYVGHIHSVDGLSGCFRGLGPKLVGAIFATIIAERVAYHLGLSGNINLSRLPHDRSFDEYKESLKLETIMSLTTTIIAQPFHVVSVRMMAQFIGRENIYENITDSFREIWTNEGFSGFFAGLVPKLIWNVGTVFVASSAVYLMNKYLVKKWLLRQYNAGLIHLICASALFPFQTVGICSIVSGSRLAAGNPPAMPAFNNWMECYRFMTAEGTLRRGNALFMRRTGPISKPAIAAVAAAIDKPEVVEAVPSAIVTPATSDFGLRFMKFN